MINSLPLRPRVKPRALVGWRLVPVMMMVRQLKTFPLTRTQRVLLRLLSLIQLTRPMTKLHQWWWLLMLML